VQAWPEHRAKLLRKRLKEKPDLKFWEEFFTNVSKSDFLMGKVKSRDHPHFEVDLEWLIRPTNFLKVLEGKYANKTNTENNERPGNTAVRTQQRFAPSAAQRAEDYWNDLSEQTGIRGKQIVGINSG
jgi:hypothetical protein